MSGKNIVFPLGNLPIKLAGIVTENKSPTHSVCLECKQGSVGHKNYCKNCGIENTKDQIGSGIEDNGQLKIFSKDQMSEIQNKTKNIFVKKIIDIDQFDLRLKNDKGYYLLPNKEDENRLYQKVFSALKATNKALLCTWKYNTNVKRDKLALVLPLEKSLALFQINFKEELNEIPEQIDLSVDKDETIQGIALLQSVSDGSISDIVDQYQIDLANLLSGKAKAIGKKKESGLKFSPQELAKAASAFKEAQTESEQTESKSKKSKKRGSKN